MVKLATELRAVNCNRLDLDAAIGCCIKFDRACIGILLLPDAIHFVSHRNALEDILNGYGNRDPRSNTT